MTLAIFRTIRRAWPAIAERFRRVALRLRRESAAGHEARVRSSALRSLIRAGAHRLPREVVETSEARAAAYRARMGLPRNS